MRIIVQELNEDRSVRLDDQGLPIEQSWSESLWNRMEEFWGTRLRWRKKPLPMPSEPPKKKTAPKGD
jgi:hypothetical protein